MNDIVEIASMPKVEMWNLFLWENSNYIHNLSRNSQENVKKVFFSGSGEMNKEKKYYYWCFQEGWKSGTREAVL